MCTSEQRSHTVFVSILILEDVLIVALVGSLEHILIVGEKLEAHRGDGAEVVGSLIPVLEPEIDLSAQIVGTGLRHATIVSVRGRILIGEVLLSDGLRTVFHDLCPDLVGRTARLGILAVFYRLSVERHTAPQHIGTIVSPGAQELALGNITGTLAGSHRLTLVKVVNHVAGTIDLFVETLPPVVEAPVRGITAAAGPVVASPVSIEVAHIGGSIEVLPIGTLALMLPVEALVGTIDHSVGHIVG